MREPRHERPVAALLIGVLATIWLATTATSADASVQTAETPARSYYLVSLDRASLADAAEAVLVQSLRSEAVVDPGLTGTVTFRVSEPLSDRELEDIGVCRGEVASKTGCSFWREINGRVL